MSVTVGELFVLLGFKIEGLDDVKDVDKSLEKTVGTATKLAIGIDLVTAGMVAMIHTALDAAVGFRNFELATGLSSQELQQWQHRATMAGVSAGQMQQAIEGVQKVALNAISTGEGLQWFKMLGINPAQNPFIIFDQMSAKLKTLNPQWTAFIQQIGEKAGFTRDIFAMMRGPDPGRLPDRLIVQPEDIQRLKELNDEWKNLVFVTGQEKTILISELAPEFRKFVRLMEEGANQASKFIGWLQIHPNVAKGLADIGIALAAVGASLTIFATAAKATALAVPVLTGALAPLAAELLSILAAVNALVEGYRLIQSFRHGNHETEDFIERNKNFKPGTRHGSINLPTGGSAGAMNDTIESLIRPKTIGQFTSSMVQHNSFVIHESGNPARTQRAVQDGLDSHLQVAAYSAEPDNY